MEDLVLLQHYTEFSQNDIPAVHLNMKEKNSCLTPLRTDWMTRLASVSLNRARLELD